jgi:diphthamide biosynthesis protein 2
MATIAASGEDAITQTLDVDRDDTALGLSPEAFEHFYEIARTAEGIKAGGYKRVSEIINCGYHGNNFLTRFYLKTALQFPDELLHDAVPIYHLLRAHLPSDQELYVLADTSYGR